MERLDAKMLSSNVQHQKIITKIILYALNELLALIQSEYKTVRIK